MSVSNHGSDSDESDAVSEYTIPEDEKETDNDESDAVSEYTVPEDDEEETDNDESDAVSEYTIPEDEEETDNGSKQFTLYDLTGEGYDCKFVQPPADDQQCPLCKLVVKNAYQVNCCHKIFCHDCLCKIEYSDKASEQFRCPHCRHLSEGMEDRYFEDTKSNREIQSLQVYCYNQSSGCNWKGKLGMLDQHSLKCKHQTVTCEKCSEQMLKRDSKTHAKNHCPMRLYKCPHCKEKGTYESITNEPKHTEKMLCENPGCKEMDVHCRMMMHHELCPMEKIKCPYHDVGCTYSAKRSSLGKHVKDNVEQHLDKAVKRMREMEPAAKTVCPHIIKFSGFSKCKVLGQCWYSPGVYTSEGGYKFCLRVYPNGSGAGKGSHVSVFIHIMTGEYDDILGWPVRANFIILILNQIANGNHYRESINFDDSTPDSASQQRDKETEGKDWGKENFMPLSLLNLTTEDSQYLKDDNVYFRVEAQLHSETKPWLTVNDFILQQ